MAARRSRFFVALGTLALLLGVSDLSMGLSGLLLAPGDLKARLRLDEGSGTSAADSTGNGNTGTLQNGPTWVAGQSGQAVSFDGTDDYVSMGTGSLLNVAASGAFTLSAWVKTTESYGPIVSFRHSTDESGVIDLAVGYDGSTTDAGKIMALVRQDSGTSGYARVTGGTVNNGAWRHVALVRGTTGSIELFLDGVSQGTNSGSQSSGAITTDLRAIGSERRWVQDTYGTADQRYLAGSVDEVHFYNRNLSASEIQGLAHDAALEAWYKLDEGTGTTAQDTSGNDDTGTLQNGPTWVAGQSGQAVSFDGTDDYVSLGTGGMLNIPSAGAFSLSAWVKTTESAGPVVSFRNSTQDGAVIDLAVGYDGSTADAGKIMALVRQDNGTSGYARVEGPSTPVLDPRVEALEEKLSVLTKKRQDTERLAKEYGPETVAVLLERMRLEEVALNRELLILRNASPAVVTVRDRRRMAQEAVGYHRDFVRAFQAGTPDEKRRFIRDFVGSIEVDGRTRKIKIGYFADVGNSPLTVIPRTGCGTKGGELPPPKVQRLRLTLATGEAAIVG